MDDPFVSCPYEAKHRVPRSRIQAHIVKCKEKKPDYIICPYNATHRLPKCEMKQHMRNCQSKIAIFPLKLKGENIEIPPDRIETCKAPDDEIWDD